MKSRAEHCVPLSMKHRHMWRFRHTRIGCWASWMSDVANDGFQLGGRTRTYSFILLFAVFRWSPFSRSPVGNFPQAMLNQSYNPDGYRPYLYLSTVSIGSHKHRLVYFATLHSGRHFSAPQDMDSLHLRETSPPPPYEAQRSPSPPSYSPPPPVTAPVGNETPEIAFLATRSRIRKYMHAGPKVYTHESLQVLFCAFLLFNVAPHVNVRIR